MPSTELPDTSGNSAPGVSDLLQHWAPAAVLVNRAAWVNEQHGRVEHFLPHTPQHFPYALTEALPTTVQAAMAGLLTRAARRHKPCSLLVNDWPGRKEAVSVTAFPQASTGWLITFQDAPELMPLDGAFPANRWTQAPLGHLTRLSEFTDSIHFALDATKGTLLHISKNVEAVLGHSADKLKGSAQWRRLLADPTVLPHWWWQLQRGDLSVEVPLTHADGATRYFSALVWTIPNKPGTTGWIEGLLREESSSPRDRALRETLDENAALLREVNHRVRNNLGVITGLLYLQGRAAADPNTRQHLLDSRNRLQAIALIHERLYRDEDASEINVGAYLRELVGHLRHNLTNAGHEVSIELTTALLERRDTDTALSFGILANELISYTARRMADLRRGGKIVVSARRRDNRTCLTVSNNASVENAPGVEDLSMQLIKIMLERLNGELTTETDAEGAHLSACF